VDKYEEDLKEVLYNLRSMDTNGDKGLDSYIDDSIKRISKILKGE